MKLALEVYIADLEAFADLVPDDLLRSPEGRPSLQERMQVFAENTLQMVTETGEKLPARLDLVEPRNRVDRKSPFAGMANPITRQRVPEAPTDKRVLYAEISYPFERKPQTLTIVPPFDDEGRSTVNIGFIAYHKSVPIIDFRYLSGPAHLTLDWPDPWYSKFDNPNLKRHHKDALMSFLYVEPFEVRHEILVRVKDMATWMDLGLRGDAHIEVDELQLLKQRVGEFLLTCNPVLIDGKSVNPILDRTNFVQVALTGIQVLEAPERLDINDAIIGVIITCMTDGLPQEVTVDWELFTNQIERVPATATDPAGPLMTYLQRDYNVHTWTNYLKNYKPPTVQEQDFELIEYLSVLDNVLHPCRISRALQLIADTRARAADPLDRMGLADKLGRGVEHLSQGEKLRVAICRALLPSPSPVLADEVTGNLDPRNKVHILDLLFQTIQDHDATLLVVTHDHELLLDESERQLSSRAASTPLLLGAKVSALDLVMNSLYFDDEVPELVSMAAVDEVEASELAVTIPLYVRFQARGFPIVGTTLDYFDFRGLKIESGRQIALPGECVVGAKVAERLALQPGDTLLSSPQTLFDLAGVYPLKMKVSGVLARSYTSDDLSVFVDIKTAWVVQGLAHGHQDLTRVDDTSVLVHGGEKTLVANAKLVEYNEIIADNLDSFHFHGASADYPLTALLVLPEDERAGTLLHGRHIDGDTAYQLAVPAEVIDGLLANIFRIKNVLDAVIMLVSLPADGDSLPRSTAPCSGCSAEYGAAAWRR